MISPVFRISTKHNTWYYQEFGPDSMNPLEKTTFRLYDSNGDFVAEFDKYEDMIQRIKSET